MVEKDFSFIHADNEVHILIHFAYEDKVHSKMENVGWETCQGKYSNMLVKVQL